MTLTLSQQLFVVFYAIFWGTAANAQPRWKAFHWPLLFRCAPASWRLLLSLCFLNVLPIAFFAWGLLRLAGTGTAVGVKDTLLGVVPAFAVFGFYRLWLGIAELGGTVFYRQTASTCPAFPVEIEPTIECLHIDPKIGGWWNVLYGLVYIVIGVVVICAFA